LTSAPFEAVVLCCISPPFGRLSTTQRQITYVLLTRAPLYRGLLPFSCDLHVLSAPLTFVLSQDQTLQKELLETGHEANRVPVALLLFSLADSTKLGVAPSLRRSMGPT
jgi:hypothetical protein